MPQKAAWCALALAAMGAIGYLLWENSFLSTPSGHSLHHARVALIEQDYLEARDLADQIPKDNPDWNAAQLVAGEACALLEDYDGAILRYSAIPKDGSPESIQAAFGLGENYRAVGELTQAEREYFYVLEHEPSPAVHERLAFLQALTRRLWEARPHYLALVQSGEWTLKNLGIMADLERPLDHGKYLAECAERAPEDVSVRMGLAANALYSEGQSDVALPILEAIVAQSPENLAAQAMLGEALLSSDGGRFLAWHAKLPPNADESADIWYVRGLWARREKKWEFAARCFWETVRKVPIHRRGNYQLGQVLEPLGHPASQDFATLAGRQFQLTQYLDDALEAEGKDEAALKGIVEIMEQSGRYWEGRAWARTAGEFFPQSSWPRTAFEKMNSLLAQDSLGLAEADLARKLDLSHFPATDEDLSRSQLPSEVQPHAFPLAKIRFQHETNIGLDFVYFNGDDPSTPGVRMFEQSGGGVAVLDLDSDGWPDLYFTQGAKWIQGENSPRESAEFADQVFRNIEGQRFVNVTELAGFGDRGFGQGAAVGDYNADGFPDLYIANVGQNRLYQNNGDGTFRDVTEGSGLHLKDWTSSCLMADLNADGLPDLFDVNYLTGPEVYSIICQKKGCSPSVFEGVPDRLHLNQGDGTFQYIERATPETNSKGLGILAFDLHERNRPCLFVANDQVPNHFLRNYASEDAANIRLEDEAFLSGLGHNMDGLAMACMGIAADDVNQDGLLDLFVTNFKSEPNTLYIQDAEGLFIDRTNLSGLYHPSLPMTGWGTQFLDADLDGSSDLVVANGHVYPDDETEYRMRAQFFRNGGFGHFAELPSEDLGSYFEKPHAGRSVARLDWNRDGLMDFAVCNINEPAALLTNTTKTPGHFLGVRLSATTTSRDAIGSIVEVEASGRRWTKQLLAGDGFQASNERLVHFGLGASSLVASIQVTWPSGQKTLVKDCPADGVIELVEGIAATFVQGRQSTSIAAETTGLPK